MCVLECLVWTKGLGPSSGREPLPFSFNGHEREKEVGRCVCVEGVNEDLVTFTFQKFERTRFLSGSLELCTTTETGDTKSPRTHRVP